MVRDKLTLLKQEILKYIGLPYFKNVGKYHNYGENSLVGKGTAKEIALKTIEIANLQDIKLLELSPEQIYNFQKRNRLGIDCSGLTCNLLNFYFHTQLNPRKTSSDMLTLEPLAQQINLTEATTGDLIRQKNGKHVLFIIDKIDDTIYYVDSSLAGRGVRFGEIKTDSISLQSVHRIRVAQ